MGFRKQDRSLLAHWLKQQKQEIRKKEEALETGKLWFGRARLAAKEGKQQLAKEAHKRALDAKQAHDKAVRRLESIAMELDTLRGSLAQIEPVDTGAAARAEQIQQNFAAIGIDSGEAELNELADRSGADRALGRLRQTLNGDEEETSTAPETTAAFDTVRSNDSSSMPRLSELMEGGSALENRPNASDAQTAELHQPQPDPVSESGDSDDRSASYDSGINAHRDSGIAQDPSSPKTGDTKSTQDGFAFEKLGPKPQ